MSDQTALAKVNNYFGSDLVRSRFETVVGGHNAGAYIASVMLTVAESEALQKCSMPSIYTSALRAATLRLSVEPTVGQAYLVPFKGKAVLVVGYKGLYDMAVRTGKYRYINVFPVYEGEIVSEDRFSGWHKITGGKKSDTVIGWMGAFELFTGFGHTFYMTVDEIHDHAKKYSKSYTYQDSPWKTETRKMERKTVLRLMLRRWGYLDPSDVAALDLTESGDDTIEAPVVESVTVKERSHMSEDEIMGALYSEPKPAPKLEAPKQPEPDLSPMTYEQACDTLTGTGKRMGDLKTADLDWCVGHPDDYTPAMVEAARLILSKRSQ